MQYSFPRFALHRDEPAKSLELLTSASPYERAHLEAVYLRGLAYLRLNKGGETAADSERLWITKAPIGPVAGVTPYWAQFYSLSHLGLARGSALAGNTATAKKAFQDLFEIWKGADSDIPILQQAKAEYAKLR